jgi:hypothetical protein
MLTMHAEKEKIQVKTTPCAAPTTPARKKQ